VFDAIRIFYTYLGLVVTTEKSRLRFNRENVSSEQIYVALFNSAVSGLEMSWGVQILAEENAMLKAELTDVKSTVAMQKLLLLNFEEKFSQLSREVEKMKESTRMPGCIAQPIQDAPPPPPAASPLYPAPAPPASPVPAPVQAKAPHTVRVKQEYAAKKPRVAKPRIKKEPVYYTETVRKYTSSSRRTVPSEEYWALE